jgi:hypothetical protein
MLSGRSRRWRDHPAADRQFRPEHLPRPAPEDVAAAEAEVHAERARYAAAAAARDFETAVVYTGEAIDMIHSIEPAEAILHRVVAGAEAALARRFD